MAFTETLNGWLGNGVSGTGWIIGFELAVFFGSIILASLLFYKFVIKYDYKVVLRMVSGNAGQTSKVTGGYVETKDGLRTMHLLWPRGTKVQDPQLSVISPHRGLFKRHLVEFWMDADKNIHPVSFTVNSPANLNVNFQDRIMWFVHDQKQSQERWKDEKSFWQEHAAMFINVGVVVLSFILMFYLIQKMGDFVGGMGGVAAALQQVAGVLTGGG